MFTSAILKLIDSMDEKQKNDFFVQMAQIYGDDLKKVLTDGDSSDFGTGLNLPPEDPTMGPNPDLDIDNINKSSISSTNLSAPISMQEYTKLCKDKNIEIIRKFKDYELESDLYNFFGKATDRELQGEIKQMRTNSNPINIQLAFFDTEDGSSQKASKGYLYPLLEKAFPQLVNDNNTEEVTLRLPLKLNELFVIVKIGKKSNYGTRQLSISCLGSNELMSITQNHL